jgi:hypothetical protein
MKKIKVKMSEVIKKAKAFIESKNPELLTKDEWLNFDNIYFAKTGRRSMASRNGFAPKYGLKKGLALRIGLLPSALKMWYSYDRKTPSGWICPINGIEVDQFHGLEIVLVHEFTHIAEYILNQKGGELQTTINEQEYVFENYPQYAKFLIPFETRKLQEKFFKRNPRDRAIFQKINGRWTFIDPEDPPKLEGRVTSIPPLNWKETHKQIRIGVDTYYQEKVKSN